MSEQDFILERTLGEGAFGKVYLVTEKDTNEKFAMKIIDLRTSPSEEKDLAIKEASLLQQLKHPHILRYSDAFEANGAFCIVTEYCAKGDLSEYLAKQKGAKLEEDLLREWFRQISSALQYLHDKTIIHRDVKTPNIFLTETNDTKLGDMGLAKVLERPSSKAVTFCGSPYYMSPEIFSAKPYDKKSDIWALGVIVYEMATLERPFDAMLMHQLVSKIIHGGLPRMPDGYGKGLTDLLTKMMNKDPNLRPSAEEILQHDYIKGSKPLVPPKRLLPPNSGNNSTEFPKKTAVQESAKKPTTAAAAMPRRSLESDGEVQSSRWDNVIDKKRKQKGGPMGHGGPFNVEKLLGSLALVRRKNEEEKKNLEGSISQATVNGITTILAHSSIHADSDNKRSKKNKIKKDVRPKAWEQTVQAKGAAGGVAASDDRSSDFAESGRVSASEVTFVLKEENQTAEDFSRTLVGIQTQVASDAFDLLSTVVSMVTQDLPKDQVKREQSMKVHDDQMRKIVIQIEHLQQYCIRVLKEDMGLFSQVQEYLANIKDEDELERKLIELIGKEMYDRCGIQLLYWRNFEYNLKKLQDKARGRR